MTPTAFAEALFVSTLQPSEHPDLDEARKAVEVSLQQYGGESGCAAYLAAEYGEHPEVAADRMRWALSLALAA